MNKKFYSEFDEELERYESEEEYEPEYYVLYNLLVGDEEDDDDNCIGFEQEHFMNLSNGDEITLEWENDQDKLEELEKYLDIELVFAEYKYTVKDRPEPVKEVNPFTDTYLRDDGEKLAYYLLESYTDEEGNVNWYLSLLDRNEEGYGLQQVSIEVDTMGHEGEWKIGDKIQVTISEDEEFLKEELGLVLTERTGIITIESLGEE